MHNGDWPLRNVSLYVSHINSLLFHDYNIYGRAFKNAFTIPVLTHFFSYLYQLQEFAMFLFSPKNRQNICKIVNYINCKLFQELL